MQPRDAACSSHIESRRSALCDGAESFVLAGRVGGVGGRGGDCGRVPGGPRAGRELRNPASAILPRAFPNFWCRSSWRVSVCMWTFPFSPRQPRLSSRWCCWRRPSFRNSSAADLGALGLGKIDAFRVGVGMIPRGEVGMIVAQIGLGFGILSRSSYSVVVFMSVATTIVAPPLIKVAYRSLLESRGEQPGEEVLRMG